MPNRHPATEDVLLWRRGLVFLESQPQRAAADDFVKAVEIEWAALGYVPSSRLRAALAGLPLPDLAALRERVITVLAKHLGARHRFEPLFRNFPNGIPNDTADLWLRKVLVHFLQTDAHQPCLFCRAMGTTHVLSPCLHVVCDRCFDGENYSACPVCERQVDRASPFFRPSPRRVPSPKEKVQFKLLDLGNDSEAEARKLVSAFCDRKQAMSPADRSDFETLLRDIGQPILSWLPNRIPVKENVALIFGSLFTAVDPAIVLPIASQHLKTATDVLRFIAVLSNADASLQPQQRQVLMKYEVPQNRFFGTLAKLFRGELAKKRPQSVSVALKVRRFRMTKLSRPLRRALLQLLESFNADSLIEDMLRHRSYWVWVGEFLHPHEYAKRFPNVARAFQAVRKQAPDGTPAPRFAGFYSRLEAAASSADAAAMLDVLRDRPGELGRRLDHLLRIAGQNEHALGRIQGAFKKSLPRLSTPVLLTLYRHLPLRTQRAATRVYWPKGPVTTGVSAPDARAPLAPLVVQPAVALITAELLRRFGEKPAFADAIVDSALGRVMVPFNERTAARSAVALPRGSVVPVPRDKLIRLFLHWCEPQKGGQDTDIDLSVGFYHSDWSEAGVCSYYSLKLADSEGLVIAKSGGDRQNAPFPDGAAELIDVNWSLALRHDIRYAVMVVNNYSGMPFSLLERGFAGLMLRSDPMGDYFDPRTVELKFDLQGKSGIYMPLVLDLKAGVLHWLDVYSKGDFLFNNVATSKRSITRICPTLIDYFTSGIRPSMYDLALLHAAARCDRVHIRHENSIRRYVREAAEDTAAFHARLLSGQGEPVSTFSPAGGQTFAALYRGDLELAAESTRYVLFPERVSSTLQGSDLVS